MLNILKRFSLSILSALSLVSVSNAQAPSHGEQVILLHGISKIRADKPVHFIGYSMGGIVTRAVLNKFRPDNLGRVVQLASPNNGSEVADFLKDNWLYEKVYGPAGKQLVTDGAGIDDLLGKVDYELGVVAGTFSIDPVSWHERSCISLCIAHFFPAK